MSVAKKSHKVITLQGTRKKGKQKRKDQKILSIALLIALLIGVYLGFRPNAYEVSINGKVIGAVKEKAIIEKAKETVEAQLKTKYHAEISFEEEPVLRRYRAKKNDYVNPNYLVTAMRENLNVLIGFKEVVVEGKSIGILPSSEALEELKEELKVKYYGKKEVEVEFAKKVELKDIFAKETSLTKMDKLVEKCLVTTPKTVSYEVQKGDSLWSIASSLGISIEALLAENEGLQENTVLQLGQTFKAKVHEPLLPLKVVSQKE
ncbi:hypothetical protein CS063_11990 [Sporanaerobium hydrogeniformans]|uniref:Uncharacterized protein n=1 Tax=Sporanaerobium hydrogeniformans TaxID=3072179 RepID=A0AC61DCC4_9FIRM|nr:LysM domain-containing protein [Sporanaerobium hydrogeniformans]PHV70192.1 hypothetical protein CS063_11990 [Sporanaerobium hydrogeniformans]